MCGVNDGRVGWGAHPGTAVAGSPGVCAWAELWVAAGLAGRPEGQAAGGVGGGEVAVRVQT